MPRSQTKDLPTFESSMEELEAMVETMESGQLPLEDLIAHYEKGAKLIASCECVLNDARKRLELITLKPTASDAPSQANSNPSATPTTPDHHDDEIRLF